MRDGSTGQLAGTGAVTGPTTGPATGPVAGPVTGPTMRPVAESVAGTGGSAGVSGGRGSGREVIGVALIDQVPLFREGLAQRLARTGGMRLVGATGHLPSAVRLREQAALDVLVVDAVLDPGAHLTQLLSGVDERLAVLVLIREPYRTGRFVAAMQAAGVHGLALRASAPERIVEAIRRTHADRRYLDPGLAPLLGRALSGSSIGGGPDRAGSRRLLSNREFQVLQLVADGLSNQAIAELLFVSVETVRTHIKGVLRKLEARDRAHAVAVGFQSGLLVPQADRIGAPVELGRDIPLSRVPR